METVITIVVIVFLVFMVYSMIKYAKFIHNYPQSTDEETQTGEEDSAAESQGDDSRKD